MSSASLGGDWVGRVIDGRFTLLRWLGGTDRSRVYLTEIEGDPARKATVKLIPADGVDAERCLAAWAEAKGLSHPHLMRLLDAGHCEIDGDALLYVVTDCADEVLAEILPGRPLAPDEAKEMLEPVLDALLYLHEKGFVHGHLKPSNIMAVHDRLMLSVDSVHAAGKPGNFPSPPSVYDAPESDAPEAAAAKLTPAMDVWSLGVTLVEVLTQQAPDWDRSSGADPVVADSIPQPFAGIARECLRIEPARRCSVGDVRARLSPPEPLPEPPTVEEPEKAPEPVEEASPPVASEQVPGRRTERTPTRVQWGLIVAAVLVLLAVIVALWVRPRQIRPTTPTDVPSHQAPAPKPAGPPVKGTVAHRVLPKVPESASATIEGHVHVRVRLQVDREGNVAKAAFADPGPSRYFARLAINAARQWKFKPAQVDGKAAATTWILHFRFGRTGLTVTPVEVTP